MNDSAKNGGKRFGFISTRFRGTDGVTLEARKWAEVLQKSGHSCYWFAGELDDDLKDGMLVEEAFFDHPRNKRLDEEVFGRRSRRKDCTDRIESLKKLLKAKLYEFVESFQIDMIIAENCLTIPMHVPLGLALTELIAESEIPVIAHHHDFRWERDRYTINAVPDYLQMAFPPRLNNIQHVVINSAAQEQMAFRLGITSVVIPNVLDFSQPMHPADEFCLSFRKEIGLTSDDILILQPTRLVSRKGIEHVVDLVHQLKDPRYKLVVTHEGGDEGLDYQEFLTGYARDLGVDMRLVHQKIRGMETEDQPQRRFFTLEDAYRNADLVTYPSLYEGFGNAFLEAIYFRKPLVVNRYSIYIRDIEPKGFDVVQMNGYITRKVVEQTRRVLEDRAFCQKMVNHNFELGKKYYSYRVLERQLSFLVGNVFGVNSL